MKRRGSVLSLWSRGSILSIGSRNSILSIGSVGSVASIGAIGSFASAFSVGSALSIAAIASWRSIGTVRSRKRRLRGRSETLRRLRRWWSDQVGSRRSTIPANSMAVGHASPSQRITSTAANERSAI